MKLLTIEFATGPLGIKELLYYYLVSMIGQDIQNTIRRIFRQIV